MIASNNHELIEFSTAEQLAATFAEQSRRIFEAFDTLTDATGQLAQAFSDNYGFDIDLYYRGDRNIARDKLADGLKRAAWKAILNKLGIWKTLSSKRAEQLRRALDSENSYRYGHEERTEWPDITPESVVQVAAGYASSATEFLEEAVAEEYDFWKPSKQRHDYQRNSEFRLNRKIIRPYMISPGYGRCRFSCNHHNRSHITALDNIFHMLAGRKGLDSHTGPLAAAIDATQTGAGETEFFRFRCHKNGNLHLEFKRTDLLALFNKIAGRNRLPSAASA